MVQCAGVVRAHRQLVDQRRAVGGLEQLDREQPDDAELGRRCEGELLGLDGQLVGRGRAPGRAPRRRCRPAARSPRPGTPRPARTASGPPARPARGANGTRSSAISVDARRGSVGDQPRGLGGDPTTPHAPAVVAAAVAFSTTGQPTSAPNALDGRRASSTGAPRAGTGHAELGRAAPASRACPGRARSASAPGRHRDALGGQRPDVLGRHVLVVEGDHVAALGERAQVVEVG